MTALIVLTMEVAVLYRKRLYEFLFRWDKVVTVLIMEVSVL